VRGSVALGNSSPACDMHSRAERRPCQVAVSCAWRHPWCRTGRRVRSRDSSSVMQRRRRVGAAVGLRNAARACRNYDARREPRAQRRDRPVERRDCEQRRPRQRSRVDRVLGCASTSGLALLVNIGFSIYRQDRTSLRGIVRPMAAWSSWKQIRSSGFGKRLDSREIVDASEHD
jgi:hypothetical protein